MMLIKDEREGRDITKAAIDRVEVAGLFSLSIHEVKIFLRSGYSVRLEYDEFRKICEKLHLSGEYALEAYYRKESMERSQLQILEAQTVQTAPIWR